MIWNVHLIDQQVDMYARPKPGETEEDLLRLQEEFFAQKLAPAATVIRHPAKRRSTDNDAKTQQKDRVSMDVEPIQTSSNQETNPPKKKSRFRDHQEKKQQNVHFDEDPEELLNKHDKDLSTVISEIVERDVANMPVFMPTKTSHGFPAVHHRGNIKGGQQASFDMNGKVVPVDADVPTNLGLHHHGHEPETKTWFQGDKHRGIIEVFVSVKPNHSVPTMTDNEILPSQQPLKKSLFSQQFEKSSRMDFGIGDPLNQPIISHPRSAQQPQSLTGASNIVDGTGLNQSDGKEEAMNIHEENTSRITAMSEQEILNEQRKLMESLDPSLLGFLKSRKMKVEDTSYPEFKHIGEMDTDTPDENTVTNLINEDELPLKPSKEWVNMDTVESEKLSWMKDLPPPTASQAKAPGGQQARFDMNGKVVPVDADVPTNLGLHHHGHEPETKTWFQGDKHRGIVEVFVSVKPNHSVPTMTDNERAGYSLEELFTLARSANMQQRVFALQVLAKIIINARAGDFCELLQQAVLPSLVEGGLVFLIRWALDDNTDNTLAAAVQCFHALLVHQHEEMYLEETFAWHKGCEVHSLSPAIPDHEENQNEDETPQQTDADVIKHDLIKGLLRMTLLMRLRYILEKWKPPAPVVTDILDILIRIARHSVQSSHEIIHCPRLVSVIVNSFLPTSWKFQETTKGVVDTYGYPCPKAMKLMQVLCTSGRHLTANLVSNYQLLDRIFRYIAVTRSELQLSVCDTQQLVLWSLNTWKICSCYGFGADYFKEYYPVMTSLLQQMQTLPLHSNRHDNLHTASMLSVLESVLHIAASTAELARQTSDRHDTVPLPTINWSHVIGLSQPVQMCMQRHLEEFVANYPVKRHDLGILAASLNFMASYLSKVENQPGCNTVEILEHVETLCDKHILPCLLSHAFQVVLANISCHSLILSSDMTLGIETLSNLPRQGSHMGNNPTLVPIINKSSPFNFLIAFFRFLTAAAKIHKGLTEKLFRPVLENQELVTYLRKLCVVNNPLVISNHFLQFENSFQILLLNMTRKLAECSEQKLSNILLYHQMAVLLVTHLRIGDEHMLHELLSTILFNFEFLHDTRTDKTSRILECLQLTESDPLQSVTNQPINVDHAQLLTDICANLSSIRASYITGFAYLSNQVKKSRSRELSVPHEVDKYLLGGFDQVLVPRDWMYLPILELYKRTLTLQEKAGMTEESVPPSLITAVTNTLRWVFFLHNWRSHVMNKLSMATKITRIMCTFLAGSDLFLEKQIHSYMAALLQIYCKSNNLDNIVFTEKIPGLASFYDFYKALLIQYEAVSFGDPVFGSYILFPLQQRHMVELRKCVWGEHAGILRFLSVPVKQLQIPMKRFLEPAESDMELVRMYYRCLMLQTVRRQWCPVMYAIALHHVTTFMYSHDPENTHVKKAMLEQCVKCSNEELKKHLLFYKMCDMDAELGFVMYDILPQIRKKTLDNFGLKS